MVAKSVCLSVCLFLQLVAGQSDENAGCVDDEGLSRSVGESWKAVCNNCRCLPTGVAVCTKRFCLTGTDDDFEVVEEKKEKMTESPENTAVNFGQQPIDIKIEAATLLKIVPKVEGEEVPTQCGQKNVNDCQKVEPDVELLTSLSVGNTVPLTPNGINLKLRSEPSIGKTSTIFVMETGDGLEAIFTLRKGEEAKLTGSINTADKIYVVESCGPNCHVFYYRDRSVLNGLQD